MIVYSNKFKNSDVPYGDFEFEVLNELKDCSNRTDANCISHNRFLFEMDKADLKEQCMYARTTKNIITRCVYSGSKSIHMIIEFPAKYEDFCKENYRTIWEYINNNVFDGKCDTQCRNPSRLTRRPGVIRKDTGKEQTLLFEHKCDSDPFFEHAIDEVGLIIKRDQECSELRRKYISYMPKHEGCDCSKWEVVKRYLDTPFPLQNGNGNSSTWLYAAIQTCLQYHDDRTLNNVIAKAKCEGWTEREIRHKMK